jgi:hypothetical protein
MILRFAVLMFAVLSAPMLSAQPTSTVGKSSSTASNVQQSVNWQTPDPWRFSVTPYAWAMGITGSVSNNGSRLGEVKLTSGDVLSNLTMAAMVVAEAHYGRWGVYLDAMYGDLGSSTSRVVRETNLKATTSVDMTIVTIAPSYNLQNTPSLYLDGLLGARLLWQNATTTLSLPETGQSLSESGSLHLADAVIGVKGRWHLGHSDYFVPFYVDVGAGQSSSFTNQAYVGLGRSFSWGDVSIVAKNVYYRFKPNERHVNLNLFGAAVAATFRF